MAGWCKAGSCCGCYALMLTVLLHAAVASDSCCLDEQTAIMRRKEAVKNAILSKLGMTEPPQTNITREDLTPAIMRVYQAAMKRRRRRSLEDLDEPDSDTGGHHFYSRPINLLDVTGEIGKTYYIQCVCEVVYLVAGTSPPMQWPMFLSLQSRSFLSGSFHARKVPIGKWMSQCLNVHVPADCTV